LYQAATSDAEKLASEPDLYQGMTLQAAEKLDTSCRLQMSSTGEMR
jgi:hypothetical protein